MTAQSALVMGQRAAERLMVDRVTIGRPGPPMTDPDTGEVTTPEVSFYPAPSWPEDHRWKRGPGKVQTYEAYPENAVAGGQVNTEQMYRVDVPVGSCDPRPGDIVTIVEAQIDPNLAGRKYRVTGLLHKSMPTAYRLRVKEDV